MIDDTQCEGEEIGGGPCGRAIPRARMVLLEWMPPEHRESHDAAGNSGQYPLNGSVRVWVCADCADDIVAGDPEWAHVARRAASR